MRSKVKCCILSFPKPSGTGTVKYSLYDNHIKEINQIYYDLNNASPCIRFLIQYLALNDINSEGTIDSEKKMINMAISKVIEDILDIDDKLLASKMKAVFKKEFDETQAKTQERNKKIAEVFNKKLGNLNTYFKDSINILRSNQ